MELPLARVLQMQIWADGEPATDREPPTEREPDPNPGFRSTMPSAKGTVT